MVTDLNIPTNCIPTKSQRGFSLIEVTMTIGILSFALIPLLGLMGVASQTNYDADSIFLSSSIANGIMSQVQQADSSQIETWEVNPKLNFYFDYEGLKLKDDTEAVFTARLRIMKDSMDFGASVDNPFVKNVVIHVCSLHGPNGSETIDELIATPEKRKFRRIRTYRTLITRLEK